MKTGAIVTALALALAVIMQPAGSGIARAQASQGIAALVNDEPISDYDVRQRMRLVSASTRQRPSDKLRKETLQQLIDERLMMQEAKRLDVKVPTEQVREALSRMAARSNMNLDTFRKALQQIGVDVRTLTDKVEAELSWRISVQRKFGRSVRIEDSELDAEIDKNNPLAGEEFFEVELQQITLLFTGGQPSQGTVRARMRDAEYIRSKFKGCESARATSTGVKDVVFRRLNPQSTANLSDTKIREAVHKAEVGDVLDPRTNAQGVELLAVCSKKAIGNKEAARASARATMINQQFAQLARRHLRDLRQDAIIDIR